jgi:Flp pilus assembly protein TadD
LPFAAEKLWVALIINRKALPSLYLKYPRVFIVLAALFVLLGTFVCYRSVLDCQALSFDDDEYVVQNVLVNDPSMNSAVRFLAEIARPSTIPGYYSPLCMISLMLDYGRGDGIESLRAFHETSLLLHLLNTLLLFAILVKLFRNVWLGAGLALLFGCHPMTVEAVAWVGERKTVLATFFAWASILCFIQSRQTNTRTGYWASLGFYFLTLLSKPTTLLLPFVLLLLDYWPLGGRRLKESLRAQIPFFILMGVSAFVTIISQQNTAGNLTVHAEQSIFEHILILCHNFVFYWQQIFWPVELTTIYPKPNPVSLQTVAFLWPFLCVLVFAPLVLWSLRKTRVYFTGVAIYTASILPTLGIIGFTITFTFDKYAYFPALGVLLILAFLGLKVLSLKQGKWIFGLVFLALMSLEVSATRAYLTTWNTTESHVRHLCEHAPSVYPIHFRLATLLKEKEAFAEAIPVFEKTYSLQQAFQGDADVKSGHQEALLLHDWGFCHFALGEYVKAIPLLTEAVDRVPANIEWVQHLALAMAGAGAFDEAINRLKASVQAHPNSVALRNRLAIVWLQKEDPVEALKVLDEAIQIDPKYPETYRNRGAAFMMLNQTKEAIEAFETGLKLNPRLPGVSEALQYLKSLQ